MNFTAKFQGVHRERRRRVREVHGKILKLLANKSSYPRNGASYRIKVTI